jgi:hypothetical protein
MEAVMRVTSFMASCLLIFAFHGSAAAAPASIFKYEIVHNVTPKEIWHSSQDAIDGSGASIIYFEYDHESGVAGVDGEWRAQGLVIGGLQDVDSIPVMVRLWSKKPLHLNMDASDQLRGKTLGAVAAFDLDGTNCAPSDACEASRFQLSVKGDGKVYANGELVGTPQ